MLVYKQVTVVTILILIDGFLQFQKIDEVDRKGGESQSLF